MIEMEDDLSALFHEAETLEKLGKSSDAFDKYTTFIEKVSELMPSIPDEEVTKALQKKIALAYNNRGFIRYNKVDFTEAVEDYTKSIAVDSSHPFTFYNRGLIHYRLGRFSLAIGDMKKALVLDPSFESAAKCMDQSQIDLQKGKAL